MNLLKLTPFFTLLATISVQSQDAIKARIIDTTTQQTIPFATIAISNNSGVISNDQGNFQLYLPKNISGKDSLVIQCLGYETKRLSALTFKDSIIFLKPKSIELEEVLISNKDYSVEEVIEKANQNLMINYDTNLTKSTLFYRASYATNIIKHEVKLKKTSIPELNQKFIDSILNDMPKYNDDHTEILANLYGKPGVIESQKLDIIKASHLYDKNKEITFNNYEERFNNILKKHVKRDSYFKIKSGIFGTKQDMDSTIFETKEQKETNALLEEKKKEEQERKKNFLQYRKQSISRMQRNSFVFEDSYLNFLEKSNRYIFKIEDYSFLNDNFVYKISFTPKRKEDFKGTLYINTDDFAIVRVDYENTQPLKTFNLLGISFKDYLKKGTLIYAKNTNNKYALKYAEVENGNRFGIKRPLKIIEKNKHTSGRRKQNELTSDIHFILSNTNKKQLVIFENESISDTTFANFEEKPTVEPIYLPAYDPDFWKGYNVIEPNQAIKTFKSIE
ncbi:MAG: DUF5686 and carboxypeptidase regulatory-like domain-containing protein [Flavobacteriaceae bacterium]|nr:DUF5686 and carboxypeptidase regulatory-like domain-containing protein [Flavobacteriaceae bacterium]